MKILALKPLPFKYPGIKLYEYGDVEVPFIQVIHNNLIDWDQIASKSELGFKLLEIKLKNPATRFYGIVTYENYNDLVNFLLTHYEPTNDTMIDHVLRISRQLERSRRKKILLETLIRDETRISDQGHLQSFKKFRIRWFADPNPNRLNPFLNFYELVGRQGNDILRWETPDGYCFGAETRFKNIVYLPGEVGWEEFWIFVRNISVCFYWNGQDIRMFYPEKLDKDFLIKVMGKEKLSEFEKSSRSREIDRDYLPPPDFQMRYWLRVPSRKEVDKYLAKNQIDNLTPKTGLERILFLYDGRAIRKNENCSEISSLVDSLAILSRAPGGIYLSDDHPSHVGLKNYLEDKEYYIAAGVIK